ncbi:leucine-rich repeat domain-containing protein [Gemelliphila palaticanis]|uniref:Leucine-rich repeat domain-containing protein n=1 Tax=Gemelliphila palaticanis TaxID=81950 RepID=A0ABX2T0M7_9BACL|nr:leucine-rich repeat domain-containing protein [Gemella palaticanis]MBF0715801.1 leucine-rich repeat domain-containing protein [Gemella palaticanis]NYS47731.1 leucine-rich repeat domain-containing protein [Gemella palaticanis]
MFDDFASLYFHRIKDDSYIKCFENNEANPNTKKAEITANTPNWQIILKFPNLEELILDHPTREQVEAVIHLPKLKRLHIIKVQLKNIEFLKELRELEELKMVYISGFSDLSPIENLSKLKSLYIQNFRRISDFSSISSLKSLKYLSINGTFDWKQAIKNFDFLGSLENLEYFSVWLINCKDKFPLFRSDLKLKKLKNVMLSRNEFSLEDYVFWETYFPNVKGTKVELAKKLDSSDNLYFLGKGDGYVNANNKNSEEKINAYKKRYEKIKSELNQKISDV